MEKIVVKWKDGSDSLTVQTDGYIPPDRSHFNYWTLYLDKERMTWKEGPDSVLVNSDQVKSIAITEVNKDGE